mmetsp:Transcript_122683/g.291753  ORF Transcript_122683/g.291753 Transcript_122683/m.291753 type:complete len:238 (-) Transcript_122683:236-949(-)
MGSPSMPCTPISTFPASSLTSEVRHCSESVAPSGFSSPQRPDPASWRARSATQASMLMSVRLYRERMRLVKVTHCKESKNIKGTVSASNSSSPYSTSFSRSWTMTIASSSWTICTPKLTSLTSSFDSESALKVVWTLSRAKVSSLAASPSRGQSRPAPGSTRAPGAPGSPDAAPWTSSDSARRMMSSASGAVHLTLAPSSAAQKSLSSLSCEGKQCPMKATSSGWTPWAFHTAAVQN